MTGPVEAANLDAAAKDESRIEMLKRQSKRIADYWKGKNASLDEAADAYAELLNDHSFVVSVNEYTSQRYDEVMQVMPTLRECDELIKTVTEAPDDSPLFEIYPREKRLEKLRLFRQVCRAVNG